MTWKSFHNRGETLRSVIDAANSRRDGRLPLDVPGVEETFADELELLAALQLKWHTRLAGQIERVQMDQPMDLPASVVRAWGLTCDEMPGVRAVLDHYREHPLDAAMAEAMRKATLKEHAMLAVMAGRAGVLQEDVAAPIGARLEREARVGHGGPAAVPLPAEEIRPTLLERLRQALAA